MKGKNSNLEKDLTSYHLFHTIQGKLKIIKKKNNFVVCYKIFV